MRAINWEGVLGEIRNLYFFPYSSQVSCNHPTSKNTSASYFSIPSAINCTLRAHMPEAPPAALTAVVKIYTMIGPSFTKPKRSSHLFHLV